MNIANEKETVLIGTIHKITYINQLNGYTVAELKSNNEIITVVGIMPFAAQGDVVELRGKYIVHSVYGQQFSVDNFQKSVPDNEAAILRYLSSGAIKGIGPATAIKIVEKFGNKSLEIIDLEPEQLSCIRGISIQKALAISNEYKKQYGIRDIMLLLSKYKVPSEKCLGIYKSFRNDAIKVIKSNPYVLCEEGIDFSFELTENIAEDFGFDKSCENRICAGLQYVLRKNLLNGHSCLPRDKFITVASSLLGVEEDISEKCCDRLIDCFRLSNEIINGKEFISIPEYYSAEQHICARLLSVKRFIDSQIIVDDLEIQNVENKLNIKFEDLQRKAIFEAFSSGVLVLTGGPGTGKTTTLNAIIQLFEGRDLDIELAAPTGRAAKRMTELTGREAKTIHRLLEVEWGEGEKKHFARNERNPLSCEVIIIDEASMIDTLLFNDLLKALKLSCRIIIVGDSDQLPSIGAGNVLGDILNSGIFPSICLKKVFRQAKQSMIVNNAHAIINNQSPDFSNKESDCFFIHRRDKYSVVDTILQLICSRLPNAYNISSVNDVQIICPSRLYETGTVNINNLLQEKLNPPKKDKPQLSFKGFYLREGDKVMQIKNNYDLQYVKDNGEYGNGVFNGDVGYITDIDIRGGILKVRFDDKVATYFSEDLSQLELAYAITVHKSQGSEYDYVVIPFEEIPSKLKYRNLLYTAVTRAKKMLIAVGREEVWQEMAANDKKTLRYTLLQHFLEKNAKKNI